jgi:hypothetical protein
MLSYHYPIFLNSAKTLRGFMQHFCKAALILAILLTCNVGCKRKPSNAVKTNPVKNCLKVVDGTETNAFPSMGFLLSPGEGGGYDLCGGTFVSSNTMISASHCVTNAMDGGVVFVAGSTVTIESEEELNTIASAGVKPLRVFSENPSLNVGGPTIITGELAATDISILIFPNGTAPATTPIATTPVKENDSVTVVGYGATEYDFDPDDPVNQKRAGGSKVIDVDQDIIIVGGGDGNLAAASAGDSGGPLFYGSTLIGSLSTRLKGADLGLPQPIVNIYVNLQGPKHKNIFAAATAAGAVINSPLTTVSSPAPAGGCL